MKAWYNELILKLCTFLIRLLEHSVHSQTFLEAGVMLITKTRESQAGD